MDGKDKSLQQGWGAREWVRFRDKFGFVLKLGRACVLKHMIKRKNQERKKGKSEADHREVPEARRAGIYEHQ